jgi:hypothetical protein
MSTDDPIARRLIALIDDLSPTTVQPTLCSFYDVHSRFT